MSSGIDQLSTHLEALQTSRNLPGSHALWVCFLNPEGFESFASIRHIDGRYQVTTDRAIIPREPEISTVRFTQDNQDITVVATGYNEDGILEFETIEALMEAGELPLFAANSLRRRVQAQPYNLVERNIAIQPLLRLPPLNLAS